MMSEPLINTLTVKTMFTRRQHLQLLTVPELPKADAALHVLPRAAVSVRRCLVQDYGKLLDRGGGQPLLRWTRRRVEGGGDREVVVVAADPARVEEENRDEDYNGEQHDDEEQCPASDFKIPVVNLRVAPVQ